MCVPLTAGKDCTDKGLLIKKMPANVSHNRLQVQQRHGGLQPLKQGGGEHGDDRAAKDGKGQ
jgi:hypothetical protein